MSGSSGESPGDPCVQREPFGISYDRFRVSALLTRLARENRIQRALEVEARGAKCCPSLYSLPLGLAGSDVWLHNGHPPSLAHWERLGLAGRAHVFRSCVTGLPFPDASFDLVWNFVTLQREAQLDRAFSEMARVSRGLVLVIFQNGYNFGYPWHHFLHWAFALEWTHGRTETFFPGWVKDAFRTAGIEPTELTPMDQVPWPEPPGFRDVKLHRAGVSFGHEERYTWDVPSVEYLRTGFPIPYRFLGFFEELPVPILIKLPVNQLFGVVGRVRR